jgi:hypothetical protein
MVVVVESWSTSKRPVLRDSACSLSFSLPQNIIRDIDRQTRALALLGVSHEYSFTKEGRIYVLEVNSGPRTVPFRARPSALLAKYSQRE